MTVPFNTLYADGGAPLTGDGLNTFVQTVDTFPTLRSFIGIDGMQVSVGGQASSGDGKGGVFYFNSSSTASDDNLTVIVPTGGTGAWLRLPITLGITSLSSADGASATFADIGAQAASGANVSAQNLDFHFLDSAGTRQTLRYTITSVGTVITTTGIAASLDFNLSGAGAFGTGDNGSYRINGRTVASGAAAVLSYGVDAAWTTINLGNTGATVDAFGQWVFASGTNLSLAGGYLNLVAITAPGSPSLGWVLYNDIADDHIRLKKSDGTIVDLTP
jgi:hypothetical protein